MTDQREVRADSADAAVSRGAATTARAAGSKAPWVVVGLGAVLFVLVLSAAADYTRQVVKESLSEPAGVLVVTNSATSAPLRDGTHRVSVFVVLRNKDLEHDAKAVHVAAHVSAASGDAPSVLSATVPRLAPNQTTAVIMRATGPSPATLRDVQVSVDDWVPQYPWSQSPIASLSVSRLSGKGDAVVARVTNSSSNPFTGKLVELAFDAGGGVAGGAEAAIPRLRAGQAVTIRLPRDGAPHGLTRELYVQQG